MKNFSRKRRWLAWALCALLACALFPANARAAAGALWQPAYANHYGRSDIRAYLNGGLLTAGQKNFAANSSLSREAAPFLEHFTAGELAAVVPSKVQTYNQKSGQTEETRDLFYLPAGDEESGQIFWAEAPLLAQEDSLMHMQIPAEYRASGENGAWLRTASAQKEKALYAGEDGMVAQGQLPEERGVAAVCRVSLEGVGFAAMADAKSIAENGGALLAENAAQSGMYLKLADDTAFSIESHRLEEGRLMLSGMQNAKKGAYVVLCAYPFQAKSDAAPVLMAAQRIARDGQQEIILPTGAFGQDAAKLSSYSWSVWMETPALEGEAFARATEPMQLNRKYKNTLVLADAQQLSASWGEYADSNTGGGWGSQSNQAIAFGRDAQGEALLWWICAREETEEQPQSKSLVLYQKQAAEQCVFNKTFADYPGTDVQFPEEVVVVYGQTLGSAEALGGAGLGRFAVSPQQSMASRPDVLDSGLQVLVDFIPENPEDYSWSQSGSRILTRKVVLRVVPAEVLQVQFPESAQVRYGEPLSRAEFSRPEQKGQYAFVNSSLVLEWEQDGQSFDMAYYPADTQNYDYSPVPGWDEAKGAVVRRVTVRMEKGIGKVSTPLPEPVAYDAENALSEIDLPEGWAWEQENTVPASGNAGYAAVYTPKDTDNYDYSEEEGWDAEEGVVRRVVPLVVAKAMPEVQAPQLEAREYEKGAKLSDVGLPEGWQWAEPTATLRLGTAEYTAVYTPEDTANYSQVSRVVQLEVRPGGFWQLVLSQYLWAVLGLLVLAVCAVLLGSVWRRKRLKKA